MGDVWIGQSLVKAWPFSCSRRSSHLFVYIFNTLNDAGPLWYFVKSGWWGCVEWVFWGTCCIVLRLPVLDVISSFFWTYTSWGSNVKTWAIKQCTQGSGANPAGLLSRCPPRDLLKAQRWGKKVHLLWAVGYSSLPLLFAINCRDAPLPLRVLMLSVSVHCSLTSQSWPNAFARDCGTVWTFLFCTHISFSPLSSE